MRVLLTEGEYEEVRERAHRERVSMSGLMRDAYFGGTPTSQQPPKNKESMTHSVAKAPPQPNGKAKCMCSPALVKMGVHSAECPKIGEVRA